MSDEGVSDEGAAVAAVRTISCVSSMRRMLEKAVNAEDGTIMRLITFGDWMMGAKWHEQNAQAVPLVTQDILIRVLQQMSKAVNSMDPARGRSTLAGVSGQHRSINSDDFIFDRRTVFDGRSVQYSGSRQFLNGILQHVIF